MAAAADVGEASSLDLIQDVWLSVRDIVSVTTGTECSRDVKYFCILYTF